MSLTIHSHPLYEKALHFLYITVVWNVFEGISCVILGLLTNSVALFAYGLESSIEVFSSSVVIWDLKSKGKSRDKIALKLIGCAYLLVSAYVFFDAVKSLVEKQHATPSTIGIIFMIATALVMAYLGLVKRDIGTKMESQTVLADAKFTIIDGLLSTTILVGLIFNSILGWWWMDQALALFLSGVAFREGLRELL
jgi:divalent metal cation (Fe/Co/Zn/Cd) transporter